MRVPFVYGYNDDARHGVGNVDAADARGLSPMFENGEALTTEENAAHYWEARATQFQELHDRSPDGMMIFRAIRDTAGLIVDFEWLYCNPSASRIVGRPSEELLGRRLLVEMPGNREAGLFDIYVQVVVADQPHSHEFSYSHEGLDKWFRATSIKLGDGFSVSFSDLTVRRRAEEQAARLAAIIRSSEHAIYSSSRSGTVETWNTGAEKLYGYTSTEMLGQPISAIITERCRLEHEEVFRRVLGRGGVDSFQTIGLTKAGASVHVSIMLSAINDLDNSIVGVALIARDVSEQVQLQERLVVMDRMASVGTLAAGMAHEINNPLAYLSANLDVVIEGLRAFSVGSPSQQLKETEGMVLEARGGADRIGKIVRGLMTFSRAEEQQCAAIDLRPVLDLAVDIALKEFRYRSVVIKEYGAVPAVFADDARLGQVFINLLVNAAQAARDDNAESNEIRIVTSTDHEGRATVEVRDTGPGIPAAVIGRVFDPFFTTKPIGSGVGLGLAICRNIVTGMGGEISVRNNEGRGATFRVTLPSAVVLPAALGPVSVAAGVPDSERRGTVLVVDDEPAMGAIVTRVLRDHDVTVVTKAKDALALVDSGRRFDVILSDLMMPEMSGMELYDELTRCHPELLPRVIFITGGVVTKAAHTFLDGVFNERLSKPFDTHSMRSLVRRFVAK